MGFLDDAIREHLELKRRRGADPADIERAEREALGPVRRHPEPLEGETYHDEPPAGEAELGYPAAHDTEASQPFDPGHAHASHEEVMGFAEPLEPHELHEPAPPQGTVPLHDLDEPEMELEHPDDLRPEPAWPSEAEHIQESGHTIEAEPDAVPPPASAPQSHPVPGNPPAEEHPPHLSQPTQEYEVEFDEEPVPEHEAVDDDVLEETPEFLQDTPDHDRLWFEQRPPRDFDFDR